VWAVEVIGEEERARKEGETVLTNIKIIKQNIKAREAQNHNRTARTTPSHLSSLVQTITTWGGGKRPGGPVRPFNCGISCSTFM
jgi:hypothetical protein